MVEIQAALVFQDYIQRISDVKIPIETDRTGSKRKRDSYWRG